MMIFTDVTQPKFDALVKKLVESGHPVTHAEVPVGQIPTVYMVHGHGIELHATYSAPTLSVSVVKKPIFVSLKHIEDGIREGLGEPAPKKEFDFSEPK